MSAARASRWSRRKADRPGEILEAALSCFAERGFAATRLEDIAARAGVTKGTLYLYFPNKEELFKALVRGRLLPNLERLELIAQRPGPVAEILTELVGVFAGHIAPSEVAVLPKLILTEAGNFPELARFYLDEVVRRGLRFVRALLRRGVASGEFRPIDVEHTSYCLLAPLLFSVLWKYSLGPHDDHPLDTAALARAHLDLFLTGLRAPAGSANATPGGRRKERSHARRC
jgi:AcrR family transcriptional regulator